MVDRRSLGLIERQLRVGMQRGSRVHRRCGWTVFLRDDPHLYYRHRAMATRSCASATGSILAMREIFAHAALQPKVEHLAERWPGLSEALAGVGFIPEQEAAVSSAEPALSGSRGPARPVEADDPHLADFVRHTVMAFEAPAPAEALVREVVALRHEILAGNVECAIAEVRGRSVSGAALLGNGGVAELAGVWTLEEERGRGHASAVCRLLMDRFRRRGGRLVWTASSNGPTSHFYRGLGFARMATHHVHAATSPA